MVPHLYCLPHLSALGLSRDRAVALGPGTYHAAHSGSAENVITEQVDFTFPLIRTSGRLKLNKGLTKKSWSDLQISCVMVCLPTSFLQLSDSRPFKS